MSEKKILKCPKKRGKIDNVVCANVIKLAFELLNTCAQRPKTVVGKV